MKNWLENKTILVTGASSGIGKELTKVLINKYKANVIGIARREEKLKELKVSLEEKQAQFDYVCADVSVKEDWQKIYNYVKNKNVSMLINNAGTMPNFSLAKNTEEDLLERVFKTNFYSCYYGYKTFCEDFRKIDNSSIINIGSASALCSIPGQSIYSASKSAQLSFFKIVSSEEKGKIFIATYLPGFTKTELFNNKDNAKPIFDEKSLKFINKFCMPSSKLANKIAKAIVRKKRLKKFGKDTAFLKFLNSVAPNKSCDLYLKVFKKTNFECFKDMFK